MKRIAFAAAALLALACEAGAAEIEITASVTPRAVALGREVVLTVTVGGGFQNLPAPRIPDMPDFTVYPSGTSTSFSLVNGRVTSIKISRYVLVPKREGALTILPIAVEHQGREYLTEQLTVTVTAASSVPPPLPEAPGSVEGGELLLRASVDKKRAYVSEQVTLTLKFFRRASLLSSRLIPPATTGFWVEELPGEKNYYEVEGGLQYYVTEISMALFPTVDGALEIGPATWECMVAERVNPFAGDPFDPFSRRTGLGREGSVRSERLEVEVLPLPEEGRPEGFKGAVGAFKVVTSVDRTQVRADEPLTLTATLSGVGNINAVSDLDMPQMAGFRSYDSGGSTDVSKDGGKVRGSKSFSRVYIPGVPGEYVIPGVSLAYFDPSRGAYAVASSNETRVTVDAGEAGEIVQGSLNSGGSVFAKDIRFIKTDVPSFTRSGGRLYRSRSFLLFQLLAPAWVLGAYAYRVAKDRAGRDPARVRARKARREALNMLAQARLPAGEGRHDSAWKAVGSALRNYIGDVTHSSGTGLTMDEAAARLAACGIGEKLIEEALAALERCDAAAFAPGGGSGETPEEAARSAAGIVDKIERTRIKR